MKTTTIIFLLLITLVPLACSGNQASAAITNTTIPTVTPTAQIASQDEKTLVHEIVSDPGNLNWQTVEVTEVNPIILGNAKVYLDGESLCVRHESVKRVFRLWRDDNTGVNNWNYTDGISALEDKYNSTTGKVVRFGVASDTIVYVRRFEDKWQIAEAP